MMMMMMMNHHTDLDIVFLTTAVSPRNVTKMAVAGMSYQIGLCFSSWWGCFFHWNFSMILRLRHHASFLESAIGFKISYNISTISHPRLPWLPSRERNSSPLKIRRNPKNEAVISKNHPCSGAFFFGVGECTSIIFDEFFLFHTTFPSPWCHPEKNTHLPSKERGGLRPKA